MKSNIGKWLIRGASLYRKRSHMEEKPIKMAPPPAPPGLAPLDQYPTAHAHLFDELRWLNCLLAAEVLRLRRVNFYEGVKDFRGFFIADEEIDALLAAGVFESNSGMDDAHRIGLTKKLCEQAQNMREEINRRVQQSLAQNISLPVVQLSCYFRMSEFEQQALLICLAPQIDARYEKLYAYLQNDITQKSPSVDLILSLLCQSLEERLRRLPYLRPSAVLRHCHLIESMENDAGGSAARPSFRADSRIVNYLLGDQTIDSRLLPYVRSLPPLSWEDVVAGEALRDRLQMLLQAVLHNTTGDRPVLYFYGRSGVGKKTIARALCGAAGVMLVVVDLRSLLRSPETFAEKVRLILRESLLQPCALYFDHVEKLENIDGDDATLLLRLAHEIRTLGWLIFLGSENPLPAELVGTLQIWALEIPAPDFTAQKTLWKIHLSTVIEESKWPDLDYLTARFDLTGGQIAHAVLRANQSALARDPETAEVTLADLLAASRLQSQPKLSVLARKIEPKFRWGDLVLPDDQMLQLRELADQVKHRQIVMGEWGFENKLALGRGINSLFAGPSGTGKTMAAEVMANDLGLDLYKIDLSAVVSKYIGETEKNLSRVFTEAEHSNAILFFDEADALFGKRSEVRDSHDRYANVEIAYLLQKMEEYEGITILATNLRQNIDEAFTRRIRFIIEFPFPDEEYRWHIWQGIWPSQTPLASEVDLHFMARQFKLTGGSIRNIALTAAFLASGNGQIVSMKHLLLATKREFQKMGRVIREDEFGPYAPFVIH
ncbi:MAG: ATP-binding protein [Acidobacteria bacterium]|nr:ATP-binding protein [Acidobacteriota bacterium]